MLEQQTREPQRLAAQLRAHRRLGRRAVIAFVEQQIQRPVDRWEAGREVARVRDLEQALRLGEHLLRPRDALLDAGMRADEGAGDLVDAEAAQDVQHERDLRRFRQARMTARKHHAQLIVPERFLREQLLVGLEHPGQLRCERPGGALAPQRVERTVLRGSHEPRRGIVRHAPKRPHLEGAAEGVLHDVFRQRQVLDAEDARQRGDQPPRFPPEQMLVQLGHMPVCSTGRTSTTPPPSRMGQPFDSSTASARSLASTSV